MTLEGHEDGEVDRRTAVTMFAGSGMMKKPAYLLVSRGRGFPWEWVGNRAGTVFEASEWRPHLLGLGFVT